MKIIPPPRIVIATNNSGKLLEFAERLRELNAEVLPQSEFQVPEVEETGLSFIENAMLKARQAARHTGLPVIADDSGLVVDALDGRPGIYSARFAGRGASDADNLAKLIEMTKHLPEEERAARFVCALAYLRGAKDPEPIIAQGVWTGRLASASAGENGFGYDPIFYVPTHQCTAAELTPQVKNRISHRGLAITALLRQLVAAPDVH